MLSPQGTAHTLLTSVPTPAAVQASRVVSGSISGVPKDIVYPLFESAGRLHMALTGEYIPSTNCQLLDGSSTHTTRPTVEATTCATLHNPLTNVVETLHEHLHVTLPDGHPFLLTT